MATIRIYQDQQLLIEYRLPQGRTLIGRADSCDIALPDERVSRTHCLLERDRQGGLRLLDRSTHGSTVNGKRVERADLAHGDRIGIGRFTLVFNAAEEVVQHAPTVAPVRDASHEQLLGADREGVGVVRLSLRVLDGPARGSLLSLPTVNVTVGAAPSALVVQDPDLLPEHFRLLVNRGRAIIKPEAGAVTVDMEQVRGLFPLTSGEAFEAGSSRFQLVRNQAQELPECDAFGDMMGQSKAMRLVFGLLRRIAGHMVPVLLQGESGTGKELAARGLHDSMLGRNGPFVAVNCAAITESLFESELFGHERGAFTGATRQRDGAFQAADKGTIFLDEIGEIPFAAQAKLLRALELGEVRRVGATVPVYPDVRVLAATNRDLVKEVAEGRFREDLYFRLAVLTVRLPALRERPDDIPVLCDALARAMNAPLEIDVEAMEELCNHAWPGNVRELRNVLTRALVLCGPKIVPESLSFSTGALSEVALLAEEGHSETEVRERKLCQAALRRHHGNRAAAARELGLPRTTFLYKLRKLGLVD